MAITVIINPNQSIDDSPKHYIGLSTDTKPTVASHTGQPVPTIGSEFLEYDTGNTFITYDGTNWKHSSGNGLKTVSVEKILSAASAYDAEDVLSESTSSGTVWTFEKIASENGGKGYITKAMVVSETTGIAPRLAAFIYKATPTCSKFDHLTTTNIIYADVPNLVGVIEFPAMVDRGTGGSYAVATPSTFGNLPLEFECASDADDLLVSLITLDAFTQGAGKKMTLSLTRESVAG